MAAAIHRAHLEPVGPGGEAMVHRRIVVLKRRPCPAIQANRKEKAVGGGMVPFVDAAEGDSRLARGCDFTQVGGRIQNRARKIRFGLRVIQGQAARRSRPQTSPAVLKDSEGNHRGQALFGLIADPAPILEAVNPRGGSHPHSAVARVGQVPDPVQALAHRGPGLAVVFQEPVPAAGHEFAAGQAAQNEDAGLGVAVADLERIRELAVPIEAAPGGTTHPDLSGASFQHPPRHRSLPFAAQF